MCKPFTHNYLDESGGRSPVSTVPAAANVPEGNTLAVHSDEAFNILNPDGYIRRVDAAHILANLQDMRRIPVWEHFGPLVGMTTAAILADTRTVHRNWTHCELPNTVQGVRFPDPLGRSETGYVYAGIALSARTLFRSLIPRPPPAVYVSPLIIPQPIGMFRQTLTED